MPTSRVQQALDEFRQALLEQESGQMREMAQRWRAVERRLEGALQALAEEAARLAGEGRMLTTKQVYEMERYRALLGQAYQEARAYERWAAELVTERQAAMAKLGIESSQAMIRESYLQAGRMVARFNLLPVEAVEDMIGNTRSGAPLGDLLAGKYADSMGVLTEVLISNTAKGINPRKTAVAMADALGMNLNQALVVARTEQIRVFRQAATDQMRESGVVSGWIWRAALSDRTCLSCLAMDGTEHDLDEELNDHPSGRCFRQPIITGLQPVAARSGAEWFGGLDPEQQRSMLGDAKYEAWTNGQFDFARLAMVNEDATWGREVRIATLEELVS